MIANRARYARKKKNRNIKRTILPGYSSSVDLDMFVPTGHEFVAVSESTYDHVKKLNHNKALKSGASYIYKELLLKITEKEFDDFIIESTKSYSVIQTGEDSGYMVGKEITIEFNGRRTLCTFKITGESNNVLQAIKYYSNKFEVVTTAIEWMYSPEGYTMKIPLSNDKLPIQEMYPFLTTSLSEYYENFFTSSASILVLIGPPGTGKTTFLRGMLQHYGSNALVTYDASILAKDYIFANFLEGDNDVMVIEDADNFLGNRTDGNELMHKFLNVGDGLITMNNKKLIFSTNLPSVSDIDPALIRPGRCFDVLKFNMLTRVEAEKLSDVLDMDLKNDKESYSIGDIFHTMQQTTIVKKRRAAFI